MSQTDGSGATSSVDDNNEFQIVLINGSIWHFQAPSHAERECWVSEIEKIFITSLQNTKINKNIQVRMYV